MILPDILAPGLHLVLCGTAPSRASKEAGAYYAKPGNAFWPTLHAVGLTPRRVAPADYACVTEYGLGLTDLNKTEFGVDSELSRDAYDVEGFKAKMRAFRPAAIALDSKNAAKAFLGTAAVAYGRQAEDFEGMALFVLPSPSGLARRFFTLDPWREAAAFVRARRGW